MPECIPVLYGPAHRSRAHMHLLLPVEAAVRRACPGLDNPNGRLLSTVVDPDTNPHLAALLQRVHRGKWGGPCPVLLYAAFAGGEACNTAADALRVFQEDGRLEAADIEGFGFVKPRPRA